MSRVPGPTQRRDPFSNQAPAQSPGSWGRHDAGDPNAIAEAGDNPNPVGVSDGAALHGAGVHGLARVAMQMMGNLVIGATPQSKASRRHRSSLIYSRSPEGAAKRRIDEELERSGLTIDKKSAEYWRAYIEKLSDHKPETWAPYVVVEDYEYFQCYYLQGAMEGFLPSECAYQSGGNSYYEHGFNWSRVNDAFVVFNPTGERLVCALRLVFPNENRWTKDEFQEWSDGQLPVFAYYNGFFGYPGISVMSLHKFTYRHHHATDAEKKKLPPPSKKPGVWVDLHDASHGTLGCIGVDTASVNPFNAAYAELHKHAQELDKQPMHHAYFSYEDDKGKQQFQPFVHNTPVGRLKVLLAPR
jgi:hypothetical protein